jgi:hypothetical protein
LVQSQLIVAGLWAICFYGEIRGRTKISGWFAFCALTVVSILLLTRQHESMPMEEEGTLKARAFVDESDLSLPAKNIQWAVL